MAKWIPVTEELPDEFRTVLISVVDEECRLSSVDTAMMIHGEWYFRIGEKPLSTKPNAWMPLPIPYGIKKKDYDEGEMTLLRAIIYELWKIFEGSQETQTS